ncbi:L,D-transpeptidase family protein [Zoogloea dura]|uniref:L,D-transpeptidase family protein n=1 Tax=Zoogloea dura TaxID=2728840 RepID=A0A848GCX8_9RHOO|nr:L,D-transpeptidase family protein [Zoogloea dura]NML27341.1 L,D-transpeptidase family protein [Zoogloea dura]
MPQPPVIPPASTQLLLCLAPGWEATTACLQRFERNAGGDWFAVGTQVPVVLGHGGLAWGRGLHAPGATGDKREGDGCAPAGVFAITALFGDAPAGMPAVAAARLPYHPAKPGLKCVDDPASAHYNCIVDESVVTADWMSCEDMLRTDGRYALGAVVAHNVEPALPGAGSCIFLHVWAGPETPTAGCTAMALADMRELAGWLDGARAPLLVQLPLDAFAQRQEAWGLPRR